MSHLPWSSLTGSDFAALYGVTWRAWCSSNNKSLHLLKLWSSVCRPQELCMNSVCGHAGFYFVLDRRAWCPCSQVPSFLVEWSTGEPLFKGAPRGAGATEQRALSTFLPRTSPARSDGFFCTRTSFPSCSPASCTKPPQRRARRRRTKPLPRDGAAPRWMLPSAGPFLLLSAARAALAALARLCAPVACNTSTARRSGGAVPSAALLLALLLASTSAMEGRSHGPSRC